MASWTFFFEGQHDKTTLWAAIPKTKAWKDQTKRSAEVVKWNSLMFPLHECLETIRSFMNTDLTKPLKAVSTGLVVLPVTGKIIFCVVRTPFKLTMLSVVAFWLEQVGKYDTVHPLWWGSPEANCYWLQLSFSMQAEGQSFLFVLHTHSSLAPPACFHQLFKDDPHIEQRVMWLWVVMFYSFFLLLLPLLSIEGCTHIEQ